MLTAPHIPCPQEHPLPELSGLGLDVSYISEYFTRDNPLINGIHTHPQYELYVNVSGNVSFLVEGRVYPIVPGDVLLICPNEFHHCIYLSDCYHEHYVLWLTPAATPLFARFADRTRPGNVRVSPPDTQRERVWQLCSAMYAACGQPNAALPTLAALFELLLLLDVSAAPAPPAAVLPREMGEIIEYLNANFTTLASVSALCTRFFISECTLTRRFRKYFRVTPQKYLLSKRMAEAARLLREGESVTEACTRSGFSDYSHFIQSFRREYGVTPRKYKEGAGV